MSLVVSNLVWRNFRRGGSEKLAMLALADYCDDEGGSLFPSIRAVATKISASESQARRLLRKFEREGFLSVVGNANGGAPGMTRQYRLDVAKLSAPNDETASTDATPRMDATPSTDAQGRVAPMRETASTDASQTIINRQEATTNADCVGSGDESVSQKRKRIFDQGVRLIGGGEASARSFLGKLCKQFDDAAVLAAIEEAQATQPADPKSWLWQKASALKNQSPPTRHRAAVHVGHQDYSAGWGKQEAA